MSQFKKLRWQRHDPPLTAMLLSAQTRESTKCSCLQTCVIETFVKY